jgi:hypothetical protein
MVEFGRLVSSSALLLGLVAGGDRPPARHEVRPEASWLQERVNPQAKILQDFQDRLKSYMEVHKQAAKDGPKIHETEDPGELSAAQDALAARIRKARAQARQGDIFTPEIATEFRRLMYPEVKGRDGAETKATIKEDQPGPVRLKVNARYPDDQPLPTVPQRSHPQGCARQPHRGFHSKGHQVEETSCAARSRSCWLPAWLHRSRRRT